MLQKRSCTTALLNWEEYKVLSTEKGDREETLELEGRCSKVCPMEGGHEGSCHRHTQMFAEVLYRTD